MIAIMMLMAALFIKPVLQLETGRAVISVPCFLLGAGFMLLETKAVTELALFYGSTWIVVSIVILAILIMAFFANLAVIRWPRIPLVRVLCSAPREPGTEPLVLDGQRFDARPMAEPNPAHAYSDVAFIFSGLIFSAEMRSAQSVAAALGSNLIGAMLGGCLEYNSMYFGYRSLYILAMAIYGLSMIASLTKRSGKRSSAIAVAAAN